MIPEVVFEDLGRIDYKQAWDIQENRLQKVTAGKLAGERPVSHLYFCEHPHVYTLGKSGTQNNLLIPDAFLQKIGASFYKIDRGGDITYHGPGQIVGYPIFDLEQFGIQVRKYIYLLEEAVILTLQEQGLNSERLEGATGVWLDTGKPGRTRKICAIGVRASRFVTMHGFALNINTNLDYFDYINPCGFTDKGVTSLEREMGKPQDFETIMKVLKGKIQAVFGFRFVEPDR